jgi:hypothetical protein
MRGHVPVPPHTPFPAGLAPVIGYIATREPQPLEDRVPVERDWRELHDEADEGPARHSRVVRVTAVVVSLSLVVAGIGTLLDIVLGAR